MVVLALSDTCSAVPEGAASMSVITADLADPTGAQSVVDRSLALSDTWHIVINCAGVAFTRHPKLPSRC